jgi:hypothetical protein
MPTYIMNQVGPDGVCCEDCSRSSPCENCGECPATTLLCATATASKTKCGQSGSIICGDANARFLVQTVEAYCTDDTDPDVCDGTQKIIVAGTSQTPSVTTFDRYTCADSTVFGETVDCTEDGHAIPGIAAAQRITLSSEYTTPQVIDDMLAAVGTPGTPASCGSIAIASFSLSPDGLTASGKAGAYAFAIPEGVPACYKITWDRVSTPSGGSPTVTPMEYTWDGVATVTPTESEPVPGDNTATPGTAVEITIENIVVTCTGCEE